MFTESAVIRDTGGRFAPQVGSSPDVVLAPSYEDNVVAGAELLESLADVPSEVGRTRHVLMYEDTVVKVALDEEGCDANDFEASYSEEHGKDGYIPIADSRIEVWKTPSGRQVAVLVMERVTPYFSASYSEMPDWVGYVDCAQVGHDREGRLVAYDL